MKYSLKTRQAQLIATSHHQQGQNSTTIINYFVVFNQHVAKDMVFIVNIPSRQSQS